MTRSEQPLAEADRQHIKELSADLECFLIKRVHLDGVTEQGKIRIDVEWHTGAHTTTTIDRLKVGVWAPKTPAGAVERIRELRAEGLDYGAIAQQLNDEGFRSAKGLEYDDRVVGYIARTRGWANKPGKSVNSGKD